MGKRDVMLVAEDVVALLPGTSVTVVDAGTLGK
jgi:hypothetical protein